MILDLEETFTVGEESFFESVRPAEDFGIVFEDDRETGYFYAVDMTQDQNIVDALHIYDVANVVDRDTPSKLQVVWTGSWSIASLFINGYCHALFDFDRKLAFCRNGFPDAKNHWATNANRKLDDDLIRRVLSEDGA